jgi:hypothetical protein
MGWRWQSGLVLLFLFIASGARAAPCTTANVDCTEWIEVAGGPSRVLVYRTYALNIKNDAISRALIMVHGQGRDANNYFRHAFGAAFLARSLEDTVIIAPRFASNHGGNCRDPLSDSELNWDCAQSPEGWRVGGHAVDNSKISSFDVIDEIVAKIARKDAFPNLKVIVIAGHSGGGQFVQRYEMSNRVHDQLGIPVRYVVSNPSSYATWTVCDLRTVLSRPTTPPHRPAIRHRWAPDLLSRSHPFPMLGTARLTIVGLTG